jgi:hypothetical protein
MGIDTTSSAVRDDDVLASADGDREKGARSPADANDDRGPQRAETRSREEYAEAVRGNGHPDGLDAQAADSGTGPARDVKPAGRAVSHFHSEFKDQSLDLYTDGSRWAAADTPRTQDLVSEKADIPDRLPTGEELVDSAGENSSLLERLRRGVYEESEDEADSLDKSANLAHDVFSHPPTSSYEATPSPSYISAPQHSGIDAGSAVTALFVTGLVIDRAVQWAAGYYDKHVKGQ